MIKPRSQPLILMAKNWRQGVYEVRNPDKYVGDLKKVIFRSSWELYMNQFFDNNPNVLRWSSEEIIIPYVKPTDGKVHRYFPDYWVEYKNRHGNIVEEIIEVKPSNQVFLNRKKRVTNYDRWIRAINESKWRAATEYCNKRGIKFQILTENQIYRT